MKTQIALMIVLLSLTGFIVGVKFYQNFYTPNVYTVGNITQFSKNSAVFYMYPERCLDCEKRIPPTCDDCDTYYDDVAVIDAISADLNTTLTPLISETVYMPSLFIVNNGQAYLTTAENKHHMAAALCTLTQNQVACDLTKANIQGAKDCFARYQIPSDALIYYWGVDCSDCEITGEYVDELLTLDYYGVPYKIHYIQKGTAAEIALTECAITYHELGAVPQVFCPTTLQARKGKMDLGDLRDFAEECADAAVT